MDKVTTASPDFASTIVRRPPHHNRKPRLTPEPPSVPDAKWIPLTKGLFVLVDEQDYERIADMSWAAHPVTRTTYAVSGTYPLGRRVYLHRYLMNAPHGLEVDHKDGNGLNCRRSNLRICTAKRNRQNMRKSIIPKTSRFKGVCWDCARNKWRATIKINRQWQYLGRFDVEEDAARAFDAKAQELFGEFARLNFPQGIG